MKDPVEGSRRRARRPLTADERALWKTVTRSVAPLRARAAAPAVEEPAVPLAAAPAPSVRLPRGEPRPAAKPSAPPLAPLDRRLKQRVARGAAPIDARLDLHGMTQEQAHHALRSFLRNAQRDGAKLALVITGKGAGAAGSPLHGTGRGVLKRLVPQWLRLPDFRPYVVGFDAAHGRQGGEGALYIRVRRRRD